MLNKREDKADKKLRNLSSGTINKRADRRHAGHRWNGDDNSADSQDHLPGGQNRRSQLGIGLAK